MKHIQQAFVSFVIVSVLVGAVSALSQTPSKEESLAHGARVSTEQDTTYHVAAETMPEPIGGIAAIQQNVKYPEAAKRAGIQGTVFVEVFIDEKGNVVSTRIIRGVLEDQDRLLDRAAEEAIRATKFKPATHSGKPVKVRMTIPIRFRLTSSSIEVKESSSELSVFIIRGKSTLPNDRMEVEGAYVFKSDSDPFHYVLQKVPFELQFHSDIFSGMFYKKSGSGDLTITVSEVKDGKERILVTGSGRVIIVDRLYDYRSRNLTREYKPELRTSVFAFD